MARLSGMRVDGVIIDEIYLMPMMRRDLSVHYRSTVQWYDEWLRAANSLRGQGMHGEIKNLRDLRRQAAKKEVAYGLTPANPAGETVRPALPAQRSASL